MKPRERVIASLRHEEPDRCPFQASFTPEFAARLREELRTREPWIHEAAAHNPLGGGSTYELERATGQDMLLTSVGWANSYYREPRHYTDEWGVRWKPMEYETPYGKGSYTEIAAHPLADPKALSSYIPPDPERPELYEEAARVIETFHDEYWIVGATVTTIFECAWALRGIETLLVDFVDSPDLAEAILDIPYRFHLAAAKRLARMGVDMIWIGDDVGSQRGMMISPAHWRRYLKPRLAGFIGELKAIWGDLKVAYHSDGDIAPIIPELVEIGVDILNPIQPSCMDPAAIKRAYGDRLSFWGSIDEQRTLPFGTPAEVREEVTTRLDTLGRGGGLIIGPTHNVQLDTPLENFWAMVGAVMRDGDWRCDRV